MPPDFFSRARWRATTAVAVHLYPSRRLVVRIDFGDVTINYGARTATYIDVPPFRWPAHTDSTTQTSFGLGWRF